MRHKHADLMQINAAILQLAADEVPDFIKGRLIEAVSDRLAHMMKIICVSTFGSDVVDDSGDIHETGKNLVSEILEWSDKVIAVRMEGIKKVADEISKGR